MLRPAAPKDGDLILCLVWPGALSPDILIMLSKEGTITSLFLAPKLIIANTLIGYKHTKNVMLLMSGPTV
jgi:hypothetical protein